MGIEGDRRKLYKKLGREFSDEQLVEIRKCQNSQGLDIVEAAKTYLEVETVGEYEIFEKYDNDNLNLLDYGREETKDCIKTLSESWVNQLSSETIKLLNKVEDSHFNQIINLFFSVIKKVKNNHLFWAIYGRIFQTYELTSIHLEKFKELVTEDRLNISLRDRTYLSNLVQITFFNLMKYRSYEEVRNLNNFTFLYGWKTFNDFVDDICKGSDEDIITVYRGFKVNKSQRILDDEKKQINGQGLSYTIDRDKTIFFGIRYLYYHNLMIRFYEGMKEDYIKHKDNETKLRNVWLEKLKKMFKRDDIDFERFEKDKSYREDLLYESGMMRQSIEKYDNEKWLEMRDLNLEKDRRGYIGTYTVKKKDIWFLSNIDDEKEIVVSNDKVEVKNYKVITFEDYKKYNLDIKERHKSYFVESK